MLKTIHHISNELKSIVHVNKCKKRNSAKCVIHRAWKYTYVKYSNQKAREGGSEDQGQPGLHKDTLPPKRGNSEKILHASDKKDNKLDSYYK